MKILALDSSGLVASAALMEDQVLVAEYTVNYKKTHSQTLLPMLDEIVKMTELDLDTVDAIAVAAGPGSFTGLRIGSSTAKGLALALDKPLIPVPTVDALACNLMGTAAFVCPIMDARRQQVYTGLYCFQEGRLSVIKEQTPMSVEDLASFLNEKGQEVAFLGDAVPVYQTLLDQALQIPHTYAPAHLARQRAGCVAYLGMQLFREGRFQAGADHVPIYLRPSQAERVRAMERGTL